MGETNDLMQELDEATEKRIAEAGRVAMLAEVEKIKAETKAQAAVQQSAVNRQSQTTRFAELDAQRDEELKSVPRGMAGEGARHSVYQKYATIRAQEFPDEGTAQLNQQRAAGNVIVPDTSDQHELMKAYREAVKPWRGQVGKVSDIQAQFRAKGLSI